MTRGVVMIHSQVSLDFDLFYIENGKENMQHFSFQLYSPLECIKLIEYFGYDFKKMIRIKDAYTRLGYRNSGIFDISIASDKILSIIKSGSDFKSIENFKLKIFEASNSIDENIFIKTIDGDINNMFYNVDIFEKVATRRRLAIYYNEKTKEKLLKYNPTQKEFILNLEEERRKAEEAKELRYHLLSHPDTYTLIDRYLKTPPFGKSFDIAAIYNDLFMGGEE